MSPVLSTPFRLRATASTSFAYGTGAGGLAGAVGDRVGWFGCTRRHRCFRRSLMLTSSRIPCSKQSTPRCTWAYTLPGEAGNFVSNMHGMLDSGYTALQRKSLERTREALRTTKLDHQRNCFSQPFRGLGIIKGCSELRKGAARHADKIDIRGVVRACVATGMVRMEAWQNLKAARIFSARDQGAPYCRPYSHDAAILSLRATQAIWRNTRPRRL